MSKVRIIGTMPLESTDVWWEAEAVRYAEFVPLGDYARPAGSRLEIHLRPYVVAAYTPKGVRLRGPFGSEFFVLGEAVKQRAVPTKALALADLVSRKRLHVHFARLRLGLAEQQLSAAEEALSEVME